MQALILLAHGSRHPETTKEVAALTTAVDRTVAAHSIRYAFLEVARPTLPEAIDQAVRDGATAVDVLPLFLNIGNHIVRDIPHLVSRTQEKHPKLRIQLLKHIGSHPAYTALVEAVAQDPDKHVVNDNRKS